MHPDSLLVPPVALNMASGTWSLFLYLRFLTFVMSRGRDEEVGPPVGKASFSSTVGSCLPGSPLPARPLEVARGLARPAGWPPG